MSTYRTAHISTLVMWSRYLASEAGHNAIIIVIIFIFLSLCSKDLVNQKLN